MMFLKKLNGYFLLNQIKKYETSQEIVQLQSKLHTMRSMQQDLKTDVMAQLDDMNHDFTNTSHTLLGKLLTSSSMSLGFLKKFRSIEYCHRTSSVITRYK